MKVNDSNLPSLASAAAASAAGKTKETEGTNLAARQTSSQGTGAVSGDDVHLSELVRSLRSLASDSPDRQAKLEQIARSYAQGTYQVDSKATASKIIDDALGHK